SVVADAAWNPSLLLLIGVDGKPHATPAVSPCSCSQFQNLPQYDQGTLARIFSISDAVKARNVCVRILPSISAPSNTLAAVSSSGASKTQTWSYCPSVQYICLMLTPIDSTLEAQSATRWVVSFAAWIPLSVNCTKLMYVAILLFLSYSPSSFRSD